MKKGDFFISLIKKSDFGFFQVSADKKNYKEDDMFEVFMTC